MPREKSVAAGIVSLAVFLLLEAASLLMLTHNGTLQRLAVARIGHGFMAKTWGTTQRISGYFSLARTNDELAQENHSLTERLRALKAVTEVPPYDSLTAVPPDGFKYTPAKIIKSGTNSQHNYILIDKGSDDGIVQNAGIITSKGVVGIVEAVSRHYAYAISFLNTEVNISARIGTDGAVGPLAWDGTSTNRGLLKEISLHVKFAPGDTVYTSGYSTIFPADIPLGVTGDARVINGATNEIQVTLFQDYTMLKYVTVVENLHREEIESLTGPEKK